VVDSNDHNRSGDYPVPDEFDADEVEAVTDFLSNPGALELIAELYDTPKRFVTLQNEMRVSGATIRKRMNEAQELGLLYGEDNPHFNENGNKIHPLTPKGEVIGREIRISELGRIQREIRELENEFDEKFGDFENGLQQKISELNRTYAERLGDSF